METVVQTFQGWYWLIEECTLKIYQSNRNWTVRAEHSFIIFQYASPSGHN